MLSIKRMGYLVLIVVGLCTVFFVFNLNETRNREVGINSMVTEVLPLKQDTEVVKNDDETQFIVLGDPDKALYGSIYRNVCVMMDDLGLNWIAKDRLNGADLIVGHTVPVICDEIYSPYMDLEEGVDFVKAGGRMIFAAGLPEGYTDSYVDPMMGIVEKSYRLNNTSFSFADGFFPVQETVMKYEDYNASTWIKEAASCEVYVADEEKGFPIVYTNEYEKGKILVINATLLEDFRCIGILTAGMGCLMEDFIYPVMDAECVFLDNFPVVTYIDDQLCIDLYGRTTKAFVKDVIWPVFQEMNVRNEIKYTSSVMTVASTEDAFSQISEGLFNTMGKSALQYNGEMAYAVNCVSDELYKDEAFIKDFGSTFVNYDIHSMTMMSAEPLEAAREFLGSDIYAVRGKLDLQDPAARQSYNDSYYVLPELTSGTNVEDGNMLSIASMIAGYGLVSHSFDINMIISDETKSANWEVSKYELEDFDKCVFKKTRFLKKYTLGEIGNCLNSYENLEYTWKAYGDSLKLEVHKFADGQAFCLRTGREIKEIQGGTFEKIGENYYMIRITDGNISIQY